MTSEHWQIPWVVDLIRQVDPATVLDVGCGWGKFGALVREYTNATRVDALDVNPPRYRVYDRVYLGDACDPVTLPADAPHYDLALCVDMLEHLTQPQGVWMLTALSRRARRILVVSPLGYRRQDAPGIPYGPHLSGWYPWEFGWRFRVEAWRVFPGRYSRHLRLPRSWQFAVLLSAR
jgi:hypothetical protein